MKVQSVYISCTVGILDQSQGLREAWTLYELRGGWHLSRAILSLADEDGSSISEDVLEDFFGDVILTSEEKALEATRHLLFDRLRGTSDLGALLIAGTHMPENIYRNLDLWPDWITANKRSTELYAA